MLPFIAGVAAGAVAVVVYNNNKTIRNSVKKGMNKVQEVATSGYDKTKEVADEVKTTVSQKAKSLKSKKEESVEQEAKDE